MSGRFLERWSRLKKAAETVSTDDVVDGEALLANLTPESDFGQFMRQEISEEIRRKAMKTLFSDPHFNVMDGLDIYIEDYNLSEPIPEEMMATLNQARTLLFDDVEAPVAESVAPEGCDILAANGQNVAGLPAPEGASGEVGN